MKETIKPKHFEKWGVSTDIIIVVVYEKFKLDACGITLVKMAPLEYNIQGEYGTLLFQDILT